MKKIKLLLFVALFASCNSDDTKRKNVDITPNDTIRDSSWKVGANGDAVKVHKDSVYVIIGREILPNGSLHSEVVRRVVNKSYKVGDTVISEYENRKFIVLGIDREN